MIGNLFVNRELRRKLFGRSRRRHSRSLAAHIGIEMLKITHVEGVGVIWEGQIP